MTISLQYLERLLAMSAEPTRDPFIDGLYQWQVDTFGHAKPYYRTLYRLAAWLKPPMIIELGGWRGTAAAHMAIGSPDSLVVTIDHHSDPGDDAHRAQMLNVVDRLPNITYIQGWTWDVFDSVKAIGSKCGILFIDSWHHYEYAMKDWNLYSQLLDNPSVVVCDDLAKRDSATIAGMWQFWEELPGSKILVENISTYPMGFIRYPE